jgi:DNA (cytosine-5)-methyltransferase 1
MRYLSVCAGIEAASMAWHPLGWEPIAFSEIESFPSAVLAAHYPNTPNYGDMTKFKEWPDANINVLVGGTPCQSFSVAGLRKGLDDPRGNLMLTFLAIADRYRPEWVVWENVPGVLSSNRGRDFGTFLGALERLGYGFAYRILDAQYFGVAQRRRRVFVVANARDWRRAAAVLFERHSLSGDSAPRRKTGKVTPAISASGTRVSRTGFNSETEFYIPTDVAKTLTTGIGKRYDPETDTFVTQSDNVAMESPVSFSATMSEVHNNNDLSSTLQAKNQMAVQQHIGGIDCENNAHGMDEATGPLLKGSPTGGGRPLPAIITAMQVRRLTPRECERLQGFPDDYTLIHYRNKPAADGPRYKALGNSMAVPVMAWLGKRIQAVN